MITQKLAVQYLIDEMRGCPLPVAPEQFKRKRFTGHDAVFFGHQPVRAYKHANRWQFNEPDVREAARRLAALEWDPADLVDPRPSADSHTLAPTSWRAQIQNVTGSAAAAARHRNGCPCGTTWCREETGWARPCGLTAHDLLQHYGSYSIACMLPIPTLVWTDATWLIPRTLAFILDRWQETEHELSTVLSPCSGCGTPSQDSSWRVPTTSGWKTLCPACATATLRPYRQELKGTSYARIRDRGPKASDYLCVLCDPPRPAAVWDHCHEHGLVRGPLCGRCNTAEGQGKEFLNLKGSVAHLLRCDGCRPRRTVPPHHRLAALRRHLHLERGADGCNWPMHMCVSITETAEGGYNCQIRCPERRGGPVSLHVTDEEFEHILSQAVEGLLSGMLLPEGPTPSRD
ncbi:endonuclease domain-containing protein [Streptomyces sp. NPDC059445]|uniref:endonuclease domain-containing protein n=1 Tax=Streptomyces sp. NPDC059445 TaxID=3346832 RepID=UPI0036C57507